MASIVVEASDVLDIRLPQMQVGPNVIRRKAGRDAADDALESLLPESECIEARDQLDQEFGDYHKGVGEVMMHMASLFWIIKVRG